jgi:thiol-disulfide isomerase/thioredoxin
MLAALLLFSCGGNNEKTEAVYVLPPEIEQIPVGVQYGLRAPAIEAENIDGENVSLADLHGKLVLVDFWAAWCPPCRQENPHLVKLYKQYKDTQFVNGNGFTIFSVSLDRDEKSWKDAIEKDGLSWPWQICDLQGARSPFAQSYEVTAIPASFLLDQNGVIIGTNLRGEQLDETLEELVAPEK